MLSEIRACVVLLAIMTVLTGLAYPSLVTGVAQAAFPRKANGSLLVREGKVVGSSLIGQPFQDRRYFWGRPSATSPFPYNAGSSSGSNLGPSNTALAEVVKSRIESLRAADPETTEPVPVDLVTASGSGLDPHISPAAAEYQVARVARARGLPVQAVRELVARHTSPRTLELLGETVVNVLELNLALDGM